MNTLSKDLENSLDESLQYNRKVEQHKRLMHNNSTMASVLFTYLVEKRSPRPVYMLRIQTKIRITEELLKESKAKKLDRNEEELKNIVREQVFKKMLLNKFKRQIYKHSRGNLNPKPPGRIIAVPTGKYAKKLPAVVPN